MGGRLLGNIQTTDIISRYRELAVPMDVLLDSTQFAVYAARISRGELLMKYVPNDASVHVGKYRPYCEGTVTTAFGAGSINFAFNPATRASQNFLVGDVITDSLGNALGTILTYNPATGVGTLTGNSTNVLAIGGIAIVSAANWALGGKQGMVLEDDQLIEASGSDEPVAAYREGFFVQALTSITATAITALGAAVESESGDVRIQ